MFKAYQVLSAALIFYLLILVPMDIFVTISSLLAMKINVHNEALTEWSF